MPKFPKILSHPDVAQIVSRLSRGDSVREVSFWLKEKYPDYPNNQLSPGLLDQFRKQNLNIRGNVLADLKSRMMEQKREELTDDLAGTVKRNKTYKEKLDEFIGEQVDLKKKLHQFLDVSETRFAQLFDMSQNNPGNLKPDRTMSDWLKNMLELIREIRKADGAPDQIVQHNITVKAIDETAAIFQQAIINTFSSLPIEQASKLIDIFNNNVQALKETKNQNAFLDKNEVDKVETIVAKFLPEGEGNNGNK